MKYKLLLLLLLLPQLVSAATIVGKTYDYGLEKIDDVVVQIDSDPVQKYVSKEGVYKFTVSPGNYTINASYYSDGKLELFTEQNILIKDDGDYRLDLILFEEFDFEGDINEEDFVIEEEEVKSTLIVLVYVIVIAVVIIVASALFVVLRPRKPKEEKETEIDDADKILEYIKKNKRVTQKDIRREFPHSEAKISLIIADFESQGIIRKVKKGRGNIIIYLGRV